MADNSYFDTFAIKIEEAAQNVGALVIDAILDSADEAGVPQAVLESDQFVKIVQHVKPRLIYLVETDFELDAELENFRETTLLDDDETNSEEISEPEALNKLANKWRKYDGKPCGAIAAIMVEGAIITTISRPAWRDSFEADLEAAEEEIRSFRDYERSALNQRDSAEVREKAAVLANHPSFSAGRTSFEKRIFLAEHLFPDLDLKILHAITVRAEKIDWLSKSGFKA